MVEDREELGTCPSPEEALNQHWRQGQPIANCSKTELSWEFSWEDVTSCPHLQGGSWVGLLCPIVTPPLLPTETLGFSQTSHTSPVTTCTQQVPNKRLFTEGKNNVPSITLQ